MITQENKNLIIRALKTEQVKGVDTYSFFIPGIELVKIADISRVARDDQDVLKGFQRKEIKNHVKGIVEYLDQGNVLFPNAIILALGTEVEFKQARGPAPEGLTDIAQMGTLSIPIRKEGTRVAWIVDGQQRSMALSRSKNIDIPVPVVAFVAPDLDTQRSQFILVNKARPLPNALINELLPEVNTHLPRDLAIKKIPAELCELLNKDPKSPFHNLIIRQSDDANNAVITHSAIMKVIERSLKPPLGALNQYKGLGSTQSDIDGMYRTMILFWSAIKQTFPKAWGLPATKSRLMHSVGIRVMGDLMDQIMLRADSSPDPRGEIEVSLNRIKPYCCWTSGTWDELGWEWNEVQSTGLHIRRLSDYLIHLDRNLSRKAV
jgi:DGQHR domain-containing protein